MSSAVSISHMHIVEENGVESDNKATNFETRDIESQQKPAAFATIVANPAVEVSAVAVSSSSLFSIGYGDQVYSPSCQLQLQTEQLELSPPPHIVYIQQNDRIQAAVQPTDDDPMMCCAITGFLFSWIPIIGIFTFVCNADASPSSARGQLACGSCCITACIVVLYICFSSIY